MDRSGNEARMNAIPIIAKDKGHRSRHCYGCGETNVTVQYCTFRISDIIQQGMSWCPVCLYTVLTLLQKDDPFHD